MTLAPDTPPLECRTLEDAIAVLRERGLRLSTTRRLVLEALFAAGGPVSAEHFTRELRLDLSSVYRNLELLESHGLVRHVHLGHGPGLYALRGHEEREYLFCERCGNVQALPPEQLDSIRERIREQFGYEAHFTHFPIVGRCPTCSTEPATAGAAVSTPQPSAAISHQHEHSHGDYVHSHPHDHPPGRDDHREHRH